MIDPILIDLPTLICTKRLFIRPLMPGDGPALFKAVDESRNHLRQWLYWVDQVNIWQDSELTARKFYAEFILRRSLHFAIFPGETCDQLIGMCSLHNINWRSVNNQYNQAKLGYWCHSAFQNQGFISEAVQAILQHNLDILKIQKLILICHKANINSIKIAKKFAFILENSNHFDKSSNNKSDMLIYTRSDYHKDTEFTAIC